MTSYETMPDMITEIRAQICAPKSFTAGIVHDDKVVEAAERVRFMRKWSRDQVRAHCEKMAGTWR